MLKQKDVKRATLIETCIKGQCTAKQVATALRISERRVKQIKKEVKENGIKSIQHGNRGRKPKNTIGSRSSALYSVCNTRIDEYLRTRIRWKQWKKAKRKEKALLQLGVKPDITHNLANTSKGYKLIAKTDWLKCAINKKE